MSAISTSISAAPTAADIESSYEDDLSASVVSVSALNEQKVVESTDNHISECPRDLKRGVFLKPLYYVLNNGQVFTDKMLPDPTHSLISDATMFTTEYYTQLHFEVSKFNTYNHLGARIPLSHTKINIDKFRNLLDSNYDDRVILQYLEFGFPLGLKDDFTLQPVLRNHSSAYEFYTHIDKFVRNELEKGGMTGPFCTSPFQQIMISPLMTSPKKPNSR